MPNAAALLNPAPRPAAPSAAGRVVIATLNRLDGVTGVHTHTRALTNGLIASGIPCDIVSSFSGSRAWVPLFAVRPLVLKRVSPTLGTLWYRHWHTAALKANLTKALKASNVSHVIAQCPPSAQVAMDVRDALGLLGRLDITMVCHFNASEADEYRDQGALSGAAFDRVKVAEEKTIRAVDRIVYVSSWARELVEQERGLAVRESVVVWNGIPAEAGEVVAADRESIGARPDETLLINVGTLEPRKDQIGLLRLFARVHEAFPNTRLLLVGDGPQRGTIEADARTLGISDAVTLLGHRHDVPALLKAADLYVHHAAAENCPMVLLEASRASVPWAGRPSGGVGELARALHGVALSSDSIEQSLAALRPMLSDQSQRQRVGTETRQAFLRGFTQQAMTQGYLDALGLAVPVQAVA